MSVSGDQLENLTHAYQVLGVPVDASERAIKQAYRRLVKRWHPDLYQSGTVAHAEAVQMTKLLNEAHSTIAHAPLRRHPGGYSAKYRTPSSWSTRAPADDREPEQTLDGLNTARIEYWVDFFFGAVLGVLACWELLVRTAPDSSANLPLLALAGLGIILGFGFGAAWYRAKFGRRRWWT
jgi:DnaJ domain